MTLTFNADEVFEMAEEIERNGAKFYRTAAQNASSSAVRDFLEGLAAMEVEHIRIFADMRADLTQQEQGWIFDPDNEAAKYLKAMVDGCIFDDKTEPASRLSGNETPEEIFTTAIGLEKNSIAYYTGIKDMVPSPEGKNKVQAIIKEEMGHVVTLKDKLDSLK